uniref:Uncharacterized protein n=1 Tax=viral metagenome TaxID=1070528 RepID=A0A6C0EAG9_9ZZZZ
MLSIIFEKYRKFISNNLYVYKSCKQYIIILKKLYNTITNENRKGIINADYAKYRGNRFEVILIFNKFNPDEMLNEILTEYQNKKVVYTTGKIVTPDYYDCDMNNICSNGIHYYKTIEQAYYHDIEAHAINYTGVIKEWFHNGKKIKEINLKEGHRHGLAKYWYDVGGRSLEINYSNGMRHGTYKEWYRDGMLACQSEYKNNLLDGSSTCFYMNGKKESQYTYEKGKRVGVGREWHVNGNVKIEGIYVNDVRIGVWTEWYENGNKKYIGTYVDNLKNGLWTFYHDDETPSAEGIYRFDVPIGKWSYWTKNGIQYDYIME